MANFIFDSNLYFWVVSCPPSRPVGCLPRSWHPMSACLAKLRVARVSPRSPSPSSWTCKIPNPWHVETCVCARVVEYLCAFMFSCLCARVPCIHVCTFQGKCSGYKHDRLWTQHETNQATHIDIFLGRGLEELHVILLGKILARKECVRAAPEGGELSP